MRWEKTKGETSRQTPTPESKKPPSRFAPSMQKRECRFSLRPSILLGLSPMRRMISPLKNKSINSNVAHRIMSSSLTSIGLATPLDATID